MAGRALNAAEVDNTIAQLVQMLFSGFRGIADFDATIVAPNTQAQFQTLTGYSAPDTLLLYNAMTDLRRMNSLWVGTGTLTPAADQRLNARKLLGTGVY